VSRWTPDEDQVLRALYPDMLTRLVADKLGRKIDTVYQRARRLGLKKSAAFQQSEVSGRTLPGHTRVGGQFTPGHQSWNKGTHYAAGGRSAETRFGKGHKPANTVPIGTVVLDHYGYQKQKIRENAPRGMTRHNWQFVHILLWEEHHGPVPPGHNVVFINGNKADIRIENLELITRREQMRRNTVHNYGKEIAGLYQLKGAITRQINKRGQTHEEQDRGSQEPPVCDAGSPAG